MTSPCSLKIDYTCITARRFVNNNFVDIRIHLPSSLIQPKTINNPNNNKNASITIVLAVRNLIKYNFKSK